MEQFQQNLDQQVSDIQSGIEAQKAAIQEKINQRWDKVTAIHEELSMVGATLMGASQGLKGVAAKLKGKAGKAKKAIADEGLETESADSTFGASNGMPLSRALNGLNSDAREFMNESGFSDTPLANIRQNFSQLTENVARGGDEAERNQAVENIDEDPVVSSRAPVGGTPSQIDPTTGETLEGTIGEREGVRQASVAAAEEESGGFGGLPAGSIGGADIRAVTAPRVARGLPEDAPFETLFPNLPVSDEFMAREASRVQLRQPGDTGFGGGARAGESIELGDFDTGQNISRAFLGARTGETDETAVETGETDEDAIRPAPARAAAEPEPPTSSTNPDAPVDDEVGRPNIVADEGDATANDAGAGGILKSVGKSIGIDEETMGAVEGAMGLGAAVSEAVPFVGQLVGAGLLLGSVIKEVTEKPQEEKDAPQLELPDRVGFDADAVSGRDSMGGGGGIY